MRDNKVPASAVRLYALTDCFRGGSLLGYKRDDSLVRMG